MTQHSETRRSEEAKATLFSFGYWGAGSATPALVEAANEAEKLRGFAPPLWADVRISRSVRALGFRDQAFEKLLGPSNYVWLKDLGNVCVLKHTGGIEIKNPAAAEQLLDHALGEHGRRVIFFCSCAKPSSCHRHVVSLLVKEAAKRRAIAVEVVEWPGGDPDELTIDVSVPVFRSVTRANKTTLALPPNMSAAAAASLPWGTRATLRADTETLSVLLGPALFSARGVHLQLLILNPAPDQARSFREQGGYEYLP